MNALINYLLDNLMLDFQGDLSVDMVRDFLRDDKSRDADSLRSKIIENRSTAEMMITFSRRRFSAVASPAARRSSRPQTIPRCFFKASR